MTGLDKVIEEALADHRIVGTHILVLRGGAPVFERAAGFADRETGKPVATDTIFRLASVTKPIVAATALAQIDAGVLALDDAVADYLPYFTPATRDGDRPRITIRHLLTHTAGLSYDPTPATRFAPEERVNTGLPDTDMGFEENLGRLAAAPLTYAPGTGWLYSMAIDVLGAVIAAVNGTSLQQAVGHYVLGPLHMPDTGFDVSDPERLATAYADSPGGAVRMDDPHTVLDAQGKPLHFSPGRIFNDKAFQSGGAGMAGTARDLAKFFESLRKRGGAILRPETAEAAMQNQIGDIPREPKDAGLRFGFIGAVVADRDRAQTPKSNGTVSWGGVYGHSWFIDSAKGLTAILMSNTAIEGCNGRYPADLTEAIYAELV